jgi:hypothetical protein
LSNLIWNVDLGIYVYMCLVKHETN